MFTPVRSFVRGVPSPVLLLPVLTVSTLSLTLLKQILSWLVNLRHCNSTESADMKETDAVILETFCSMSAEQWYTFSLLMARHLNMEKLIYRVRLNSVFCQKGKQHATVSLQRKCFVCVIC